MDNRYGQYNEDGTVTQPEVSILTGARIFKQGSVTERVTGTEFFYRIEGAYYDRVTPGQRAEWQRSAPAGGRKPAPFHSKKTEGEE